MKPVPSPPPTDALRDRLRDRLHAAGLRATSARVAVLGVLHRAGTPLSHGDVAEQLTGEPLDRATVYRNLTDLAKAGLLRRTDLGDHVWRFELLGDGHDATDHAHFVCTECGTVECLPEVQLVGDRGAPRAVLRKAVEVQVKGRCDDCG